MGNTFAFLAAEKKTWLEHTLVFDSHTRMANLRILENFRDGDNIYLTYSESEFGGIKFQHWFVTDKTHFIEFGGSTLDIYTARVTINTLARDSYPLDGAAKMSKMDKYMKNRIRHVLGMSNYSLCLRNCEHVANYIFRGRWVSSQMDSENGMLMNYFKGYMLKDQIRLVNTFPVCMRPHIFNGETSEKLYSFLEPYYSPIRFDYYLDYEENTYNVLIVGPTGAGKSHLINVVFNQNICHSEVSHHSVTREIYFIRGRGEVYSPERKQYCQRSIVVADTIGLCDTEWDDEKIFNLIKGRVSSNFKHIDAVFIVFRADRLQKDHVDNIKHVLKWLNFNKNFLRFQFVGTYSDNLTQEKKEHLREEAINIFDLGSKTVKRFTVTKEIVSSLVYTGFPPEETLNALTKPRVQESYTNLKYLLTIPGLSPRISLQNNGLCAIL